MGAGQLDPGLNSQMGQGVGQQGPQPLRADKLLACRRDIPAMLCRPDPDRTDKGRCETLFCPGCAHDLARLRGERLGLAPLAARHRQQCPFAERDRADLRYTSFLPDADRVLEVGVAIVRVTGQDAREPAQERDHREHNSQRREPARGLVGVGAHLPGPVPAQDGSQQHGECLGGRVIGPRRVVLPVAGHVGPPLGLSWPPGHRGDDGGTHGGHRVVPDHAALFQPAEPPLDGGDPALPQGWQPEFFN